MNSIKLENCEFASQGNRTILTIPAKIIKTGLIDPNGIYDVIFMKKAEVAPIDK